MATPNETNSGPSGESATLLHTALFKQVSSEEAEELLPHLQHAEYSKGDYIFREGDTDHRMYLLERGRVKLIRQSSDRRVQLLSIHAYGEVLGEIPVFDPHGGPRTASAVAMTSDTKVVWLEHDALFAWLDEHPRVAVDMLQVLAHRMRDNNERISELVFMDVPGRLAKTLLNLASRFGEPVEAGLKVPHDLTQEEMLPVETADEVVGIGQQAEEPVLKNSWVSLPGASV